MVEKSPSHRTGTRVGTILRITLRVAQILVALVIAGLYGDGFREHDSRWVFAEVVAGLSIVTAAVYLLPLQRTHRGFAWDAVLFIFWTGLFGAFARDFIDGGGRMEVAVWFDLVGMLLWFVTAVIGGVTFWRERNSMGMLTRRGVIV